MGVGEEGGDGHAGDVGFVGFGEHAEAADAEGGVVLRQDLELGLEEVGAEGSVGLVLVGVDELVGVFFGEVEGLEEGVELGVSVGELGVEGVGGGGVDRVTG